ncbi:DNA-3-methyladenine glycosylase family protein [Thermolongibacillus altinsuensis]
MWQEKIQVQPPYDFSLVLQKLGQQPLICMDLNEQWIRVPMYIEREPVVVSVQSIGSRQEPCFLVSADQAKFKDEIIERIATIFQWNVPLKPIQEHFLQTELRDLFIRFEGMPLMLDVDLYFCLLKCIIHQQVNMTFAYRLTERFVKQFGMEKDGVWFYPQPETVASLHYDDVRALQFSAKKAEYIIDLSKMVAEGMLDLNELASHSDEEIMKRLLPIRGIGPWTVQNFLLFGLGRPNIFPKADLGLQKAMQRLLALEKKPTMEQMDAMSERWKPYLSYATFYLWRSIEGE